LFLLKKCGPKYSRKQVCNTAHRDFLGNIVRTLTSGVSSKEVIMSETLENIVLWLTFALVMITLVLSVMRLKGFLKETKNLRIMRIVLYILLGVLHIIGTTIQQSRLIIILDAVLGIIWLILAYLVIRHPVVR